MNNEVALQPGWLNKQIEECRKEVDSWPESLKEMAGLSHRNPLMTDGMKRAAEEIAEPFWDFNGERAAPSRDFVEEVIAKHVGRELAALREEVESLKATIERNRLKSDPVQVDCDECDGEGFFNGEPSDVCQTCSGTGVVTVERFARDKFVRHMRKAIAGIRKLSSGCHCEQRSHVFLHALLVDIPAACDAALDMREAKQVEEIKEPADAR